MEIFLYNYPDYLVRLGDALMQSLSCFFAVFFFHVGIQQRHILAHVCFKHDDREGGCVGGMEVCQPYDTSTLPPLFSVRRFSALVEICAI